MQSSNLNINPYFDDFDENKNFHKVLYKPGTVVQARELTQSQTILQEQVKRIGDYLFKDGSTVTGLESGAIILDNKVRTIFLKPSSAGDVTAYQNLYVIGAQTSVVGKVKYVNQIDTPALGDNPSILITLDQYTSENNGLFNSEETIYLYNTRSDAINRRTPVFTVISAAHTFISGVGTAIESTSEIILDSTNLPTEKIRAGDLVTHSQLDKIIYVVSLKSPGEILLSAPMPKTITGETFVFVRQGSCPTLQVVVDTGIYYKNGFLIRAPRQTIVPDIYTEYPTKSIVYNYSEEIITSQDDDSLLDPAFGSSNYYANGADRLKINLDIKSIELSSINSPDFVDDFIEIIRFDKGLPTLLTNQLDDADLRKELASRTYNESGNYFVEPFKLSYKTSPAGDDRLTMEISPGSAVVGGYQVETTAPTTIQTDNTLNTQELVSLNVNTNYGNFIYVTGLGLPGGTAGLLSETKPRICELHSVKNPSSTSTRVGFLIAKHLEYVSGVGTSAIHKLYYYKLIDDTFNSAKSIGNAVCVIKPQDADVTYGAVGSSYSNPVFYANVDEVNGMGLNGLVLAENNPFNKMVFPIPKPYVENVTKVTTTYFRRLTVTFVGGSTTFTVPDPGNESFAQGDGVLGDSSARILFTVVLKTRTAGSAVLGYLPPENATFTISNNSKTATIALDDISFAGTADVIVKIDNENILPRTKTRNEAKYKIVNVTQADKDYSLLTSDISIFWGLYDVATTSVSYYSNVSSYSSNALVIDTATRKAFVAKQDLSPGHLLSNTSQWSEAVKLRNEDYYLDNGQTQEMYDHAYIRWLGGDSAPGNVLVIFDNYTHSGTGPLVTNSYGDYTPNKYRQLDGEQLFLRDCVDFRPIRVNDDATYTFQESIVPSPTDLSEVDMSYYLGRIDRVYVTNASAKPDAKYERFWVDKGSDSINPTPPTDKSSVDQLLVATLIIPPKARSSIPIQISYNNASRYTMKEIGNIDRRVILVEKSIAKSDIQKGYENGTGLFFDDFSTRTKGDLQNPEYSTAIDILEQTAGPGLSAIPAYFENVPSDLVVNYANVVTMKYVQEPYIQQISPTAVLNANPNDVNTGIWRLKLYQTSDVVNIRNNQVTSVSYDFFSDKFFNFLIGDIALGTLLFALETQTFNTIAWQTFAGFAAGPVGFVVAVIGAAVVGEILGPVVKDVLNVVGDVIGGIGNAIGGVLEGVGNAIGGVVDAIFGGCFLTTATIRTTGEPDDGPTLTTLRKLRDEFMIPDSQMRWEIDDYYNKSPLVVEVVERLKRRDEIWRKVYTDWISVVVEYYNNGEKQKAYELYLNLFHTMYYTFVVNRKTWF